MSPLVLVTRHGQVAVVQINHRKPQNPFNAEMRCAVAEALRQADEDPEVNSMVLTGGAGRSFTVGGDFTEAIKLDTPESVHEWLGSILDMYTAILSLDKPLVMAVEAMRSG